MQGNRAENVTEAIFFGMFNSCGLELFISVALYVWIVWILAELYVVYVLKEVYLGLLEKTLVSIKQC